MFMSWPNTSMSKFTESALQKSRTLFPLETLKVVLWLFFKYLNLEMHAFDIFLFPGSSSRKLSRLSRKNLYKRLLANSYFVLSFENSHCQDYITEKFFYALDSPAVPVVMGPNRWNSILIFWWFLWFLMTLVGKQIYSLRSEYERHAPQGSYLHVDDYRSPVDLAARMRQVQILSLGKTKLSWLEGYFHS